MRVGIEEPTLFKILLDTLTQGGIAVMPCDTIYGIVGTVPDSEQRIRGLKGRKEQKPFIQLIATLDMFYQLTGRNLPERLRSCWPGPLTLIVPAKPGGTLALRLPRDALLQRIIRELGRPLFSTSVNNSGEPPLWRVQDIITRFGRRVELFVDAGDLPARRVSTILDITVRPYRLVRQGAFQLPKALLEP